MRHSVFGFLKKIIFVSCILLFLWDGVVSGQQTNNANDSTKLFQKINDRATKLTTIRYGSDTIFYKPVPLFQMVKKAPNDLAGITKAAFQVKSWPWLAAVTVSSAVAIAYDQKITDWIKQTSHLFGISANTSYNVLIKVGDTKVLQLPRNGTTACYQLGQGGTSLVLAGGSGPGVTAIRQGRSGIQ